MPVRYIHYGFKTGFDPLGHMVPIYEMLRAIYAIVFSKKGTIITIERKIKYATYENGKSYIFIESIEEFLKPRIFTKSYNKDKISAWISKTLANLD